MEGDAMMTAQDFADMLLCDLIEDGNVSVCEALIDEIADVMIELNKHGKTFDEVLVCIKERFPRENGEHIAPALNKAILKGFDVTESAAHS
jgi:hypothetical protein